MTAAVDAFRGLEHAMELVAEREGVRFVNDSKATNVEAALRSIESFDGISCRSSAGSSRAATCACCGSR
jgi:UDP-N-acetylmuramoylalanine-D-glutamate ligase